MGSRWARHWQCWSMTAKLRATDHWKSILGEGSHILDSHCWQWSRWTVSLILYTCFHARHVLACLSPLISGVALD